MIRRAGNRMLLSAVLLAAGAQTAFADPHAVLVLKTDGAADATTRTRVDALVLRLAKQGGITATAGDITYSDAAAATGCNPTAATCRDDVMSTLSVDEIIAATTYVSGGELKVVVRRGGKGAPAREATASIAMIDSSDSALESGLGPLFGVTAAPAPTNAISTTTTPPPTGEQPKPATTTPPPSTASTQPDPATTVTAAPNGQVTDSSGLTADPFHSRRKLEIGGAIAGGGCVLLSFVLWGAAKNTESQINSAPTATVNELKNLQTLEQQGDSQANGGNFLFVTGLVVGGISGYFLYRDHQRASAAQHARIKPMLVDHGAGIALTYGGSR